MANRDFRLKVAEQRRGRTYTSAVFSFEEEEEKAGHDIASGAFWIKETGRGTDIQLSVNHFRERKKEEKKDMWLSSNMFWLKGEARTCTLN